MIKKFNDYIESLLESKDGPIILYFSPRLRELLSNVDGVGNQEISKRLLDLEGKEITEDITYVDIDESNSSNFRFIKWQTAINLIKGVFKDQDEFIFDKGSSDYIFKHILYSNTRGINSIRIGKFVNKVLKGSFNSNQIEDYVNEIKSLSITEATFELISGKEIEYWYNRENYYPKRYSTLWQSCMADREDIFDLYTENPESCQLLILKTKNNKLLGRALVWKLNSIKDKYEGELNAKYFMDRVYSIEDYHVNKFYNFAKGKDWTFRSYNNAGFWGSIIYRDDEYNVEMTVKVKRKEYKKYPYLDTFVRYNRTRGVLYNDDQKSKGGHILRDTGGGYQRGLSRGRVLINRFKDFFTSD